MSPIAIEIATAYVSIIPSTDRIAPALKQAMGVAGREAGQQAGTAIAQGIESKKADVQKAVETVSKARDKEADAAGKVRVAESALNDVRNKANATATEVAKAEEDLSAAKRKASQASNDAQKAEEALTVSRKNLSDATNNATKNHSLLSKAIADSGNQASTATSKHDKLGKALASIGTNGAKVAGISALIAGIGGAAGAAAGLVGELAIGLTAVGGAAGTGIATVAVGIHGIKDAFTDAKKANDSFADDAAAKAKAVQTAQDGVDSAVKGVTSAQRSLTSAIQSQHSAEENLADAKKSSKKAEQDLTDARKDATRELQDLNKELQRGKLDEEGAALAVAEAQRDLNKTLADPNADALDRAEAQHRLNEALADQQDTLQKNARTQQDANEANAKGVEGSDKVTAAKDNLTKANQNVVDSEQRVQDANQSVADAQDNLVDANKKLTEAQQNLTDAQNKQSDSQKKYSEALAKLSPNAQAFVKSMVALGPAFHDIGQSVQDSLFKDLNTSFTDLANRTLPAVKLGMNGVATEINSVVVNLAGMLQTSQAQAGITAMFAGTRDMINGMNGGIVAFTQSLLNMATVAEPAMHNIGSSIGSVFGGLGSTLNELASSGQLTALFQNFSGVITSFGPALSGLVTALVQLGNNAAPGIEALFNALGPALVAIGPALGQLGSVFGQSFAILLPDLAKFIASLANGLAPILPVLGQLLSALGNALTPLIQPLSQMLQLLGKSLAQTLNALAPAIGPLGTAMVALFQALEPILPAMGQVVAMLVQALAPALTTVFTAMQPVITTMLTALMPVFQQIAPVLTQVAGILANGLVKYFQALTPLIPQIVGIIGELLQAVLPLLPPIAQLAVSLIPLFAQVLTNLMPVIKTLADVITWIVTKIINPVLIWALNDLSEKVIPALQIAIQWFYNNVLKPIWTAVGDTIKTVYDNVIHPAFDTFSNTLHTLHDTFDTVVTGIGTIWDKLRKIFADPINFVIDTVLNNGIFKAWNSVVSFLHLSDSLKAPHLEPVKLATGGFVSGPGGPTDDKIPAMLSNGEYVLNAATVGRIGVANLNKINGGGAADGMASLIPKFQAGGEVTASLVSAHEFARSMSGQQYLMGGSAPGPTDCSGFMSAIADVVLGGSGHGRWWSTTAFPKGQGSDVNAGGQHWAGGLGNGFSIGVIGGADSGGANGHTAGTLSAAGKYPATNVESGGSHGDVRYGGPAVGADNSEFPTQYHLPIFDGKFESAGNTGGGGHGSLWSWVVDHTFKPALDGVKSLIHAAPGLGEIPGAIFDRVSGALLDYLKGGASSDSQAAGTPGTGPVQDQVRAAFARYGWGDGDEWNSAAWIISHESGWNPTAVNPSSGAFGLAQFLGSTKDQYLPDNNPNPGVQGDAMARYIKDRYGDPKAAQQFWMAHNWYDSGGIFPNNTIGINQSGKPEAVLTNDQWQMFRKFIDLLGQGKLFENVLAPTVQMNVVTPNPNASSDPTASPYNVTPAGSTQPTSVDVNSRLQSMGSDFLSANLDQFNSDIGYRSEGGAGQEIVKQIMAAVQAQISAQLAQQRTQAASFIGRR